MASSFLIQYTFGQYITDIRWIYWYTTLKKKADLICLTSGGQVEQKNVKFLS